MNSHRFLHRLKRRVRAWSEFLIPRVDLPGAGFFRRLRKQSTGGAKRFFSLELPDFKSTLGKPVVRWFKTRPYGLLWSALPALLAGLVLLATVVVCLQAWGPLETRLRYQYIVERALYDKEFERARVASLRLASLGTVKDPYLYYLALSYKGLGRGNEADDLMSLVAPLSHPVFAPAHLRMALDLLTQTNAPAQALESAITHLKHTLSLEPKSLEANNLLGRIYMQVGRWDLGKGYLASAAADSPFSAVVFSSLLMDKGEEEAAKSWATAAAKVFGEKYAQEKNFDVQRTWAMALALKGDFEGALERLQAGANRSVDANYGLAMGDVYLLWLQRVKRTRPDDLQMQISLLQKGLSFGPKNPGLLKLLTDLSLTKDAKTEAARVLLNKMLAQGTAPEILHFLLGTAAWERGESAKAGEHFRLAYEAAPSAALVANNMAFMLAMGEKPDLARALAIMNPLLEKYPGNFHFRDTRGHILVKMGRWREAVADLEFALPKLNNQGPTHTALAKAYRGLGMADLAAEHDRLSHQTATSKGTK